MKTAFPWLASQSWVEAASSARTRHACDRFSIRSVIFFDIQLPSPLESIQSALQLIAANSLENRRVTGSPTGCRVRKTLGKEHSHRAHWDFVILYHSSTCNSLFISLLPHLPSFLFTFSLWLSKHTLCTTVVNLCCICFTFSYFRREAFTLGICSLKLWF